MTRLRKMMLEELQRRNYDQNTVRSYIRAVEEFAAYFHKRPDRLWPDHIRAYQLDAGPPAVKETLARSVTLKTAPPQSQCPGMLLFGPGSGFFMGWPCQRPLVEFYIMRSRQSLRSSATNLPATSKRSSSCYHRYSESNERNPGPFSGGGSASLT